MSTFFPRLQYFFRKLRRAPAARGFTLIELLVVTLIMVLITSTILVRQARFNSATLLRSLSYSIALSIRSAQVYGTSVRGTQSSGTTVFAPAYGVSFSDTGSYLLFADVNGNGTFDDPKLGGTDAVVQVYKIGAGFQISKLCLTVDSAQNCSISSLTIYFRRPNPDANFAAGLTGQHTYDNAYIQVASISDKSNTHAIEVSATGEISVLPAGS